MSEETSFLDGVPVLRSGKLRLVLRLVVSVFLFIASLEGVKTGFKLVFAEWQAGILAMITADTAPMTGLALGVLSTALVQSSSAVVAVSYTHLTLPTN